MKTFETPLNGLCQSRGFSLKTCNFCPHLCKVNRLANKKGFCRAGAKPAVYSYMPHHGEEPPISGTKGSGTIFFAHCNMRCVYCQNHNFSQESAGREVSIEELSGIMLELEKKKCHNINLVTPTHYIPQIIDAVQYAKKEGLKVPIVYNTSGYELLEAIKLLNGIVDIYLTDMRYNSNTYAVKYSSAPEYKKHARQALLEMHKQVGDLEIDDSGIGKKGIIVRCLVLPFKISGTENTLKFIASKISKNTYISLMSQYYPVHKANNYSKLSRRINQDEYESAKHRMDSLGLFNGWVQDAPMKMDDSLGGHRIKNIRDSGILAHTPAYGGQGPKTGMTEVGIAVFAS